MTNKDLLRLDPRGFGHPQPESKILSWFRMADALWNYEGEPSPNKPHAELTSGLCSNGYVDCPRLLSHPNVTDILANTLVVKLAIAAVVEVDWVVSSAYAAITFGHEVAKVFGARFGNTVKDPTDPEQKRMLWRRLTIPRGATVLQVEELITTMGTTQEVRRAVKQGNAEPVEFLSAVGTLVHRPADPAAVLRDNNIISVLEMEIWTKPPEECPLCAAGSPRVKPKTHWRELTGRQ